MKSSSNLLSEQGSGNIAAWQPVMINNRQEGSLKAIADEVQAFFEPGEKTLESHLPGSKVIEGVAEELAQAWLPADFGSVVVDTSYPSGFATVKNGWHFSSHIVEAGCESATLLAEAQARVETILLEAEKKAAQMAAEAQIKAEETLEAAYQAGLEKARAETATAVQAAQGICDEVARWRDDIISQGEPLILGLVRELADSIFGEGVVLDEKGLQLNLNRIVDQARSLGELQVFLHPQDAARLDPAWREYQSMLVGSRVQVIPSSAILPGGCFIKGQMGSIDASVETQFDNALAALTRPACE